MGCTLSSPFVTSMAHARDAWWFANACPSFPVCSMRVVDIVDRLKWSRAVATGRTPSKGRSASEGKTLDYESPALTAELQARRDPKVKHSKPQVTNPECIR